MSEIKDLSPEEMTKRAWQRWRKMDFTWKGLALPYNVEIDDARGKRQVDLKINDGSYSTTLQQYWLTDLKTGKPRTYEELVAAEEIIECPDEIDCPGKPAYHIVHLPLYYDAEETQPTLKQKEPDRVRKKVSEIISERIMAIWEPKGEKRVFNFLWLNGAILQDVEFDHSKREDQLIAVFDDAIFTEYFSLSLYGKSAIPEVNRATFLGYANFEETFSSYEIEFLESNFIQSANFSKIRMDSLNLLDCIFCKNVNFDYADVKFLCLKNSNFRGVFRSNHMICENAVFEEINFCDVLFDLSKFSESLTIHGGEFVGGFYFLKCTLSDVEFERSKIDSYFGFNGSTVEHLEFKNVEWPKEFEKCRGAFENTTFHGTVNFTGGSPKSFAAFHGAWFERDARFDLTTEAEANARFQRELKIARNQWREEAPRPLVILSRFGFIAKKYRGERDQLLMEIESGCRSLKQAMGNAADKNMEQLFYRFETLARRYQSKTSIPEKVISRIYELSSRYGASYLRPFGGLLAIWILFSIAYWPLSTSPGEISWPFAQQVVTGSGALIMERGKNISEIAPTLSRPTFPEISGERRIEVLSVSASRIFPFGAFENISSDFAKNAESKGKLTGFIYKILGTIESFFALTLAFIFGLAVKRRFQIT